MSVGPLDLHGVERRLCAVSFSLALLDVDGCEGIYALPLLILPPTHTRHLQMSRPRMLTLETFLVLLPLLQPGEVELSTEVGVFYKTHVG